MVERAEAGTRQQGGKRRRPSDAGLNRVITLSEAHALMRAAGSERDRMIVHVLWSTGCRISEAMSLRACDVLAEDGALRLRNRKQGDPRAEKLVAMATVELETIARYVHDSGFAGVDWLFPGAAAGKHLTERQARNVFYRLASKAGLFLPRPRDGVLRPIWPHVARHSYVTHLLRSGVDLLTVAEQAGHSNIANTRKYTHLVLTDRREAVQNVRF